MKDVSDQFLSTVPRPHRVKTVITATHPTEGPRTMQFESASITAESGTGKRKSANVAFTPVPGFDVYEFLAAPGVLFDIQHGFRYSPISEELVPLFDGEASTGGSRLSSGGAVFQLTDRWGRVERCRFLEPYQAPANTRAQSIADVIDDAIPGLPQILLADGGSHTGKAVWERDRVQTVRDLAVDGGLEVYIDSNGSGGEIVVRTTPTLDPDTAVWTIRSGDGGTMIEGDRERPLDRLYNTVVVSPSEESQTWAPQVAQVTQATHPRHPSIVGVVPYFWSSPTITTAGAALSAAQAILSRVLGSTETINVTAVANPALEPGDVINVIKSGPVGQEVQATHMIDSWDLDCVTGSMVLKTRSTVGDEEEA